MKFTINREEILNLPQRCAGVAEKKTTMPILANVLMQADQDTLTLTATDLEVCLICSGGIKISKPGGFTLPAKSLLDITKEFPRGEVEFELIDNNQVEL